MNKENERITYDEFMTMFKFAPRMCYTLYDKAEDEIEKLQQENQQLKKQKDDVVECIKKHFQDDDGIIYKVIGNSVANRNEIFIEDLLRMLGEIDD